MHKITKGLKKKKKGKKSKHKEEELFKPEELEAYRKEHQAQATEEAAGSGQNEEWRKFIALTSEVDDILKKTQGDLDRIKSTSFFQRVPPPSEVQQKEEAQKAEEEKQVKEQAAEAVAEANLGIVEVSESESEEEEDDDIFDTGYIDAIAAGEVKLAYIPESPTKDEGDDPFDTSYAERAILGPAVERKGKKLVPLGAAVEVLTGRVQLPTCATQRPVSRRQILKEKDLLLGSFDDNANSLPAETHATPEPVTKTLLDDDEIPIPQEPIDLSKTLHPITSAVEEVKANQGSNIVAEFDVIDSLPAVEDEDDEEFAALAAESLSKTTKVITELPVVSADVVNVDGWSAFDGNTEPAKEDQPEEEVDPFDTTFAENILPGKAELKLIEKEVLKQDFDFNPRAEDTIATLLKTSQIKLNQGSSSLKPAQKDLLGGSYTDLSTLGDNPLQPLADSNYIGYCDPFDTSIVETVKQPGQTELKFIERELLGDIKETTLSVSDDEFDPRADEPRERSVSRPDVLNVTKTVSFDIPSPTQSSLDVDHKVVKPLTPFYVRKNSIPEEVLPTEELEDPFDTSFVSSAAPGKAELKLIENELFDPNIERNLSISDQDFDPRDDKQVAIAKVVQTITGVTDPTKTELEASLKAEPLDLLAINNDIEVKVLTPSADRKSFDDISYVDPFDTSIASNILPGKTELKLLESELINTCQTNLPRVPTDPDFDPRADSIQKPVEDLLAHAGDIIIDKPLSPVAQTTSRFDLETDNFDPFDTSIASNIQPGKTELKLLESQLI